MLARQVLHFCIAGTLGFAVDAGVVQALVSLGGADPYLARGLSVALAMATTWLYNRHRTFADRRSRRWLREAGLYVLANLGGFAVNYGAYAVALSLWPLTRSWPVIAVAIGSVAGMAVNFASARWLVFRGGPAR